MRALDRITALDFSTGQEWKAALHGLGDAADTTIAALRKATSDRQIDQREDAREMKELVGDTLSWLQYDTWPTNPVDDFAAAVAHITASIKA